MISVSSELNMEEYFYLLQHIKSHITNYEHIARRARDNQVSRAQNIEAFLFKLHHSYFAELNNMPTDYGMACRKWQM
jgi:hypothetical protein